MGTATLVSVQSYLRTTYRPDCDYVDGEVQERNMGEIPHGWLQRFFLKLFLSHEAEWNLIALPEVRVQVSESRFRVPDITVLDPASTDALVVRTPPLLCVEVFSSEDRMKRMQERVADYGHMGVRSVWVVDPWRRMVYRGQADGQLIPEEQALELPGTPVRVTVEEIFAELDSLGHRSNS